MKTVVRLASKTPLFQGLDLAATEALMTQVGAVVRTVPKGAFLTLEGTPAQEIYVITSGRLVLTEYADCNRGHVVRDLGAGDGLGLTLIFAPEQLRGGMRNYWNVPYAAHLGPSQVPLWPGSVQAVETSVAIGFDIIKTRLLCATSDPLFHQVLVNMTRMLCEHLANVWLKLAVLDAHSIEDRVMLYLNRLDIGSGHKGRVQIPFSRDQMARYLGVNRTALSRSLSRLRKAGKIDWHKNVFLLKNLLPGPHARNAGAEAQY